LQAELSRDVIPHLSPATCFLPGPSLPCKALFPRFFFNATSRLCEKFVYGGCRAKQNNFQNKEQCVQTC
ncbi:Uterine plasmin/trypsin inhibitor, partial [Heterocephalus glaber]